MGDGQGTRSGALDGDNGMIDERAACALIESKGRWDHMGREDQTVSRYVLMCTRMCQNMGVETCMRHGSPYGASGFPGVYPGMSGVCRGESL